VSVGGRGLGAVRRVDFSVGTRRMIRDADSPFGATITPTQTRRAHSRRLRAVATLLDGSRLTIVRTLRRC
jgi:hypothetical protein